MLAFENSNTHLNFRAVNNWVSSQAWPVWGQLLESQREASEKSSFIMKAQWERWVLMTEETNRVCQPPLPGGLTSVVLKGQMSERVCQQRRWRGDISMTRGGWRWKMNELKWDGQCFPFLRDSWVQSAAYVHPFFLFTFSSMRTKVFDRETNSLTTNTIKNINAAHFISVCAFREIWLMEKKTLIKYISRIWYSCWARAWCLIHIFFELLWHLVHYVDHDDGTWNVLF